MSANIRLLSSPWLDTFNELIGSVRSELLIASPYITRKYLNHTFQILSMNTHAAELKIHLITNFSPNSLLSGSLDPLAFLDAKTSLPHTRITDLPGLHAKVYIADEHFAVVTSANLTDGGLTGNYEYGVSIIDHQQVRSIRNDILKYAELGAPVDTRTIEILRDTTKELQSLRDRAEKSIRARFLRELSDRIEQAEVEVLKNRVRGRTKNAIFSQAILYLLEQRSMSTIEIENQIRSLLPHMCDENVDRVIDGKHFGKLWKHDIRNAQQYLKRAGLISFDGSKWIRS